MMRFCAKCGAQIQENVKFCPKCGAKIPEQKKEVAYADKQRVSVKRKKSKLGVLAVIALIIILGVGVAVIKTKPFSGGIPEYEQPIKEYVEAVNNDDEKLLEDAIVDGYWMNYQPNFYEYGKENLQYSVKSVENIDLDEYEDEAYYFRNNEITDGKLLTIKVTGTKDTGTKSDKKGKETNKAEKKENELRELKQKVDYDYLERLCSYFPSDTPYQDMTDDDWKRFYTIIMQTAYEDYYCPHEYGEHLDKSFRAKDVDIIPEEEFVTHDKKNEAKNRAGRKNDEKPM